MKEGLFTRRYSLGEGGQEGHPPTITVTESADHVENAISVSKHPKSSRSTISKARALFRKVGIILKFPRGDSQKR